MVFWIGSSVVSSKIIPSASHLVWGNLSALFAYVLELFIFANTSWFSKNDNTWNLFLARFTE